MDKNKGNYELKKNCGIYIRHKSIVLPSFLATHFIKQIAVVLELESFKNTEALKEILSIGLAPFYRFPPLSWIYLDSFKRR